MITEPVPIPVIVADFSPIAPNNTANFRWIVNNIEGNRAVLNQIQQRAKFQNDITDECCERTNVNLKVLQHLNEEQTVEIVNTRAQIVDQLRHIRGDPPFLHMASLQNILDKLDQMRLEENVCCEEILERFDDAINRLKDINGNLGRVVARLDTIIGDNKWFKNSDKEVRKILEYHSFQLGNLKDGYK